MGRVGGAPLAVSGDAAIEHTPPNLKHQSPNTKLETPHPTHHNPQPAPYTPNPKPHTPQVEERAESLSGVVLAMMLAEGSGDEPQAEENKLKKSNGNEVRPTPRTLNSHGARPVHLIITMIKSIRTSRLSIKNSLSNPQAEDEFAFPTLPDFSKMLDEHTVPPRINLRKVLIITSRLSIKNCLSLRQDGARAAWAESHLARSQPRAPPATL